jgi:hypothetical protein
VGEKLQCLGFFGWLSAFHSTNFVFTYTTHRNGSQHKHQVFGIIRTYLVCLLTVVFFLSVWAVWFVCVALFGMVLGVVKMGSSTVMRYWGALLLGSALGWLLGVNFVNTPLMHSLFVLKTVLAAFVVIFTMWPVPGATTSSDRNPTISSVIQPKLSNVPFLHLCLVASLPVSLLASNRVYSYYYYGNYIDIHSGMNG